MPKLNFNGISASIEDRFKAVKNEIIRSRRRPVDTEVPPAPHEIEVLGEPGDAPGDDIGNRSNGHLFEVRMRFYVFIPAQEDPNKVRNAASHIYYHSNKNLRELSAAQESLAPDLNVVVANPIETSAVYVNPLPMIWPKVIRHDSHDDYAVPIDGMYAVVLAWDADTADRLPITTVALDDPALEDLSPSEVVAIPVEVMEVICNVVARLHGNQGKYNDMVRLWKDIALTWRAPAPKSDKQPRKGKRSVYDKVRSGNF